MTLYDLACRAFQITSHCLMPLLNWDEPKLLRGPGCVEELPSLIKSLGLRRVLLVTDPRLMELGLPGPLLRGLAREGIACIVYDQTQANPTIQNMEEAHALYRENACEGIIAFGGGSPMDCAKGAGALAVRPRMTIPKLRGLLTVLKRIPPLFAVPTTAGTGSEATLACVVRDPAAGEKYAINDPLLRPHYAVLDPELTVSLPPDLTAQTGMDALVHAVEAFIGRSNTKWTRAAALKTVRLVFSNLENAYAHGGGLEARAAMLEAAYCGGVAFSRAYVGNCHGIAHNLGGMYNVPHGLANAVVLPYVLDWYGPAARKRLAQLAEAAGVCEPNTSDAEKAAAFITAIREMNRRMHIPERFECIREEDIPLMAKRAVKECNPLYPVPKIMRRAGCETLIRMLQS